MSDKIYYPLPEDTQYWFYYMCHAMCSDSSADSTDEIGDEWLTYCSGGEL